MSRDVAIEYGHCRLVGSADSYDHPRILAASARYARRLRDAVTMAGYSTTIQLLVDDKVVSPGEPTAASLASLRADARRELAPDCVLLESSLVGLLGDFAREVLDGPGSARVGRSIERYRDNHAGSLACSHDVALWHSLRLGLLDVRELAPAAGTPGPPLEGQVLPAKLAVSILQGRDREHEETADREIFSRAPSIDAEHRLLRFYLSGAGPDDAEGERWESFCRSVLDILKLTEGAGADPAR